MRKLYLQIDFFASMKIFAGMSYNAIKNIFLHSSIKECKWNNVIYKQRDNPNEIYLIKSGEFKVNYKLILFHKQDIYDQKNEYICHFFVNTSIFL